MKYDRELRWDWQPFKRIIVGFSIAEENPQFRFHAYSSGRKWNGFECPYFSKTQYKRFVKLYWDMHDLKPGEDPSADENFKELLEEEPILLDGYKHPLYNLSTGWAWERFNTMDIAFDGTNGDLI